MVDGTPKADRQNHTSSTITTLSDPAAPVPQAKIFIQQLQRPEFIGSFNNQTTTIITTVIKRNARQLGNDVFLCTRSIPGPLPAKTQNKKPAAGRLPFHEF